MPHSDDKTIELYDDLSTPEVGDCVECSNPTHQGERLFWIDDLDLSMGTAETFDLKLRGCDGQGNCKLADLTLIELDDVCPPSERKGYDSWENWEADQADDKDLPPDSRASKPATSALPPAQHSVVPWQAWCRHAPTPVATDKTAGWTLWAASRSEIDTLRDFELVLNCTGSTIVFPHTFPKRFAKLAAYAANSKEKEIILQWPDMGVVNLAAAFWRDLAEEVKLHKSVLVFCVGGHGRTGTALACLLCALTPGLSAEQSIEFVRKTYCGKCVETASQEAYVAAVAKALNSKA